MFGRCFERAPFPSPVTHFFALAPIFARLKNEKCLERAENLTETLATQAIVLTKEVPLPSSDLFNRPKKQSRFQTLLISSDSLLSILLQPDLVNKLSGLAEINFNK